MAQGVHRDIQCGSDVGEMAKLGRFEREFTVYGCAYRQDNKSCFRISEHEDAIYRFIEESRLLGIAPTAMLSHSQRTGVPAGTEEAIWQEEQWRLGQLLADCYSDKFLLQLEELNSLPPADGGYALLKAWQKRIDGRFRREEQQIFDCFTKLCCQKKQLSQKHYAELKQWSAYNWKQMEDDIILKNSYERTLHGFIFGKNGALEAMFDAQYATIYRRWQRLLNENILATPIYSKTFWFQTFSDFNAIKKCYQNEMRKLLKPCLSVIQQLNKMASFIDIGVFGQIYSQICKEGTSQEAETLKMYGQLWNCLPM